MDDVNEIGQVRRATSIVFGTLVGRFGFNPPKDIEPSYTETTQTSFIPYYNAAERRRDGANEPSLGEAVGANPTAFLFGEPNCVCR